MFFVFSCALTFTPEDFASAKDQNINILTFIANKFPEVSLLNMLDLLLHLWLLAKVS